LDFLTGFLVSCRSVALSRCRLRVPRALPSRRPNVLLRKGRAPVALPLRLSLCPGVWQWRMGGPLPAPRVLSRDGTIMSLSFQCFSWVHVLCRPASCSYDIWLQRICQEDKPDFWQLIACTNRFIPPIFSQIVTDGAKTRQKRVQSHGYEGKRKDRRGV
jgi:hypothetical protein